MTTYTKFKEYIWLVNTIHRAKAITFAEERGIKLIEHLPDYGKYGRSAPKVRDMQIIDDCDKVLAFWNGKSRGTKFTLDYANKSKNLKNGINKNTGFTDPNYRKQHSQFCSKCMDSNLIIKCQEYLYDDKSWD